MMNTRQKTMQWFVVGGGAFAIVVIVNAIAFALEFVLSFSDFGPLGSSARNSIENGLFATARAVTFPMHCLGGYSALTIAITVFSETVVASLLVVVCVVNKTKKFGDSKLPVV